MTRLDLPKVKLLVTVKPCPESQNVDNLSILPPNTTKNDKSKKYSKILCY